MAEYDENFESVDSGASETYPTSAGEIKKNGFMIISGRPCKVVDYSTAKTGKHGHAKASITGIDIFNGRKYEDSVPTSHNVEVPNIKRLIRAAADEGKEILVTVLAAMGIEKIVDFKEVN